MNKNLFKNKVVLVTGGAGFIGSHIVDKALELNAEKVISFDNLIGGSLKNHVHLKNEPKFEFVNGDICDYKKIERYVEQSDIIFNEAASKLVTSLKNPTIDIQTNVVGNFNILEIMRKNQSSARIIHASTGSVFGSSDKPFEEKDSQHPSTVYGISKLATEKYFLLYAKEYGIKASVLRYYHVFGPRQDYSGEAGVINIFLSKVLKGKAPTIFGTGEQIRCFTAVKDDVEANILLYKNNSSIGEDYNVASKTRMSVLGLANKIIEKYGPKGMKPRMGLPRMGENLKPIPDTKKIEMLGFKETVTFDEWLDVTKEWIMKDMELI